MKSSKAQIERFRELECKQKLTRVGLREIGRFHEATFCPDCDRELPDAEDELQCSCGFTRYIPPWLREDESDEGRPDRTEDGRIDWGRIPDQTVLPSTVSQSYRDMVARRKKND